MCNVEPVEGDLMSDELLDLKQAAELLQIHEKSLLKLLAEEDLPARKVVGKWRFSKEALIRWIADGKSTRYAKNANVEEETEDVDRE